ncbi:MAG TPA: MFS transporter [Bacilli bacterium]|nr:MFS transporter [Bacilli bacterium]
MLRNLFGRYDQTIWIRVIGTILTTVGSYMIRPFLALYLYDKLDNSLELSMLIIGLQSATGMIAGLFSGSFADRFGRKPVMIIALLLDAASIIGYIFADSLLTFALLTVVSGIGGALFFPAANAQVTDVVPEEKRSEVFALLHTALNVGAATGPLLGVKLYQINPSFSFAICATALLSFLLLLIWKVPETLPKEAREKMKSGEGEVQGEATGDRQPKLRLREHKMIFFISMSMIPVSLLYSQVDTIFPQHLKANFDPLHYMDTYATMLTINGVMVICFQLLIARFAERFPIRAVVLTAYLILSLTALGYGWAPSFLVLVAAEICFTIGEMLNGPVMQKAISVMAPPEFRGRYFAISGFMSFGMTGTFGPLVGAFAFQTIGGPAWFGGVIAGALVVFGFVQFRLLSRVLVKKESLSAPAVEQGA